MQTESTNKYIISIKGQLISGKYLQIPSLNFTVRHNIAYKKLSYCWETVRRESMLRIAEMDVEMTT